MSKVGVNPFVSASDDDAARERLQRQHRRILTDSDDCVVSLVCGDVRYLVVRQPKFSLVVLPDGHTVPFDAARFCEPTAVNGMVLSLLTGNGKWFDVNNVDHVSVLAN